MDENQAIFKIQRYSIHDGPGIRTTVFFQGCPLSCQWCHNPESQVQLQASGWKNLDSTAENLIKKIEKDQIFYDDSNGGVTFSGGEPLCQPELLFKLMDLCRKKEIHICLDTSGYADGSIFLKAAEKSDLILFDIKLIHDADHIKYTGKNAGPVRDNLKRLSRQKTRVLLRFPLIPGITDTKKNMGGIITFLKKETCFRNIHILPFHKAGESKYIVLKMKNHMENIQVPSKKKVEQAAAKFKSRGFNVIIGG